MNTRKKITPRSATDEEWNSYIDLMEQLCRHPCAIDGAGPVNKEQVDKLLKNPAIPRDAMMQIQHACWLTVTGMSQHPVKFLTEQVIKNLLSIKTDWPGPGGREMDWDTLLRYVMTFVPAYIEGKGEITPDAKQLVDIFVKQGTISPEDAQAMDDLGIIATAGTDNQLSEDEIRAAYKEYKAAQKRASKRKPGDNSGVN